MWAFKRGKMINYTQGNIFEVDADCLVNTVNCEGVMGKGIAFQFKKKYPKNNLSYQKACNNGTLEVGKIHYYRENDKVIINFPTKNKWREVSRVEYITTGLDAMLELLPTLDVRVVAIPALGCGNGGLVWSDVREVIEKKLKYVSEKYEFIIFAPDKTLGNHSENIGKIGLREITIIKLTGIKEHMTWEELCSFCYLIDYYMNKDLFNIKLEKWGKESLEMRTCVNTIKDNEKSRGLCKEQLAAITHRTMMSEKYNIQDKKIDIAIEKALCIIQGIEDEEGYILAAIIESLKKKSECTIKGLVATIYEMINIEVDIQLIEKLVECLEKVGVLQKNLWEEYKIVK